jgi:hypothetical protein
MSREAHVRICGGRRLRCLRLPGEVGKALACLFDPSASGMSVYRKRCLSPPSSGRAPRSSAPRASARHPYPPRIVRTRLRSRKSQVPRRTEQSMRLDRKPVRGRNLTARPRSRSRRPRTAFTIFASPRSRTRSSRPSRSKSSCRPPRSGRPGCGCPPVESTGRSIASRTSTPSTPSRCVRASAT